MGARRVSLGQMNKRFSALISSAAFEWVVAVLIVLSAVNVGVGLSCPAWEGSSLVLDAVASVLFCVEMLLRLAAGGKGWYRFFQNGWNVFDFIVVVLSALPFMGSGVITLRLFRLFKLGRLFSAHAQMRHIINALMASIVPSLGVCLLLLLLMYVYAVLGVELFRGNDPARFGDLGAALITLGGLLTFEGWQEIFGTAYYGSHIIPSSAPIPCGPAAQAFGWQAVLYFFSYMVLGGFIILNLFVGIVVANLNAAQNSKKCTKSIF